MRQSVAVFLCLGALSVFGQSVPDSSQAIANERIELAKQELGRIEQLVQMGALPQIRLDEAKRNLEDAQDEAILDHTLYGDLKVADINDQVIDEMVAAAQRRVERVQTQLEQAERLVNGGITPESSLAPIKEELSSRQLNLSLAHSRATLMGQMVALAKYEKTAAEIHQVTSLAYRDSFTGGMEHFEGTGQFRESRDLKPLAQAFAQKFDRPLPISAEGETELHRSMGFDHRGRVDVAISPNAPEGIWLMQYLKSRNIPYYAFTRGIPGRATAAHIHIGPGSTRLHSTAAD
jgi:multidrug resistance efflux pump